jgi:hypothetical protein
MDPVRQHITDSSRCIACAELRVGTDLNGRGDRRLVGQVPGVVLDVHHEGIDLGRVGEPDKIVEALPSEGPGVEVDGANGRWGGGPGWRRPIEGLQLAGCHRNQALGGRHQAELISPGAVDLRLGNRGAQGQSQDQGTQTNAHHALSPCRKEEPTERSR